MSQSSKGYIINTWVARPTSYFIVLIILSLKAPFSYRVSFVIIYSMNKEEQEKINEDYEYFGEPMSVPAQRILVFSALVWLCIVVGTASLIARFVIKFAQSI